MGRLFAFALVFCFCFLIYQATQRSIFRSFAASVAKEAAAGGATAENTTSPLFSALSFFGGSSKNAAPQKLDDRAVALLETVILAGPTAAEKVKSILDAVAPGDVALREIINAKRDRDGSTALMIAADAGQADVVRVLLSYGSVVDRSCKTRSLGMSALHLAAAKNQADVIDLLLALGSGESSSSDNNSDPFAAERLLFSRMDSNQSLPIHMAAFMGRAEAVTALLQAAVVLNKQQKKQEQDLQKKQSNGGNNSADGGSGGGGDVLKAMLSAHDVSGFCPLHVAAMKKRVEVVRRIVEACPELRLVETADGRTARHLAADNEEIDKILRGSSWFGW